MVINSRITFVYVVVTFSSQVIFVFLGMVMYVDEVETKEKYKITWDQGRPGGGGGELGVGGSGVPVYPKKIRQNTQKYPKIPKFIQIYPKLYPGILYTWNSKKVIYRIPVLYRIPDLKSPCIPYTQKTLADPVR